MNATSLPKRYPSATPSTIYKKTISIFWQRLYRRFLSPLALVSLFAPAVLTAWTAQLNADSPIAAAQWPRFLNANMDGKATVLAASPIASSLNWSTTPKCAWSLPLGDGYGLGVVADGHYFHFDALPGLERLRKIDMKTGQEIWSSPSDLQYQDLYGYEPGPRCCPTISDDDVFTLGVAGELSCRSTMDGQIRWKVDTTAVYGVVQNFFGVGSSPLIVDDLVVCMVGGSPEEDQAIAPGRLDRVSPNGSLAVAFDRMTGKERWRCGDDLASYSSPRLMTIDGRTLILLLARDHLHAIDPALGKSLGKIRYRADILESVNAMVPVVSDKQVFISDCYDLGGVLLDVSVNGDSVAFEDVWRDPPGNRRAQSLRSHMSTPVLHDGYLYGCSGRNAGDSDFRCVRFSDGKVMWQDLPGVRTTTTLLGDVLLVLSETGALSVVRCTPERFEVLADWDLKVPGPDRPAITFPSWAAPVVVGNHVLVCGDQTLLCLKLPEVP